MSKTPLLCKSRIKVYKAFAVILLATMSPLAHAYVDPGTGAYLVQALVAVVATGMVYLRTPLKLLKALWAKIRRSHK